MLLRLGGVLRPRGPIRLRPQGARSGIQNRPAGANFLIFCWFFLFCLCLSVSRTELFFFHYHSQPLTQPRPRPPNLTFTSTERRHSQNSLFPLSTPKNCLAATKHMYKLVNTLPPPSKKKAFERYEEPRSVQVLAIKPNRQLVGKEFKKDAGTVTKALEGMGEAEGLLLKAALEAGEGRVAVEGGGEFVIKCVADLFYMTCSTLVLCSYVCESGKVSFWLGKPELCTKSISLRLSIPCPCKPKNDRIRPRFHKQTPSILQQTRLTN